MSTLLEQFEQFEKEHEQTIELYEKFTGLPIKPLAKIDGDVLIQFAEFYHQEQVKNLGLSGVSGSFLKNYHYHPENEGTAKTFRNIVTEKWYYENELCEVIGITNVEYLKSNYR